jgi:hypothetical protein
MSNDGRGPTQSEARERLNGVLPSSLGEASRSPLRRLAPPASLKVSLTAVSIVHSTCRFMGAEKCSILFAVRFYGLFVCRRGSGSSSRRDFKVEVDQVT